MSSYTFKIYTNYGEILSPSWDNCVMALGTFDGVHTAHRALISYAIEIKNKTQASSVGAWCFSDLPSSFLQNKEVPYLTSLEEKLDIMFSLGLDFVAVGDFETFQDMQALDFASKVLQEMLHCVKTVCGFNHRFGRGGLGNITLLEEIFGKGNAYVVNEIELEGKTVSSSAIRDLILSGDIELANRMLGRPYSLTSTVLSGKKLGRSLNFPTANQLFKSGSAVLKNGIYASRCIIDSKEYVSVSNVGTRPTITDSNDFHDINCETYILDFSSDLYGKEITVEFHSYLREEMKFDTIDALKEQISKDALAASDYFKTKE